MNPRHVTLAQWSAALVVAVGLNGCLANPMAFVPKALGSVSHFSRYRCRPKAGG